MDMIPVFSSENKTSVQNGACFFFFWEFPKQSPELVFLDFCEVIAQFQDDDAQAGGGFFVAVKRLSFLDSP